MCVIITLRSHCFCICVANLIKCLLTIYWLYYYTIWIYVTLKFVIFERTSCKRIWIITKCNIYSRRMGQNRYRFRFSVEKKKLYLSIINFKTHTIILNLWKRYLPLIGSIVYYRLSALHKRIPVLRAIPNYLSTHNKKHSTAIA